MRILKIAVAASTTVALIGGSAVMAPVASAQGGPAIVSVDVRPEPVSLYLTTSSEVTVDVHVTHGLDVNSVFVNLVNLQTGRDSGMARASLVSGTVQDGAWRAAIPLSKRDATGRWTTVLIADDIEANLGGSYHGSEGIADEFFVKRNTAITRFNVAEPETRGSFVQMSGRLLRMDPDAGYVGYRNKTVHVLFRPAAGTGRWLDRGTVTTGPHGSFANSHTFRAWRDGAWKVRFDGTVHHMPKRSSGDFVKVR